ncbi:DUF2523 domain-containing protein [Variovorax sp. EL159]|uniref:DUF2523 domain-containing protein n=1 Tax=Variovorax sp. EL159 TaxID=1566270 RepID=UPI00088EE206|nr:DUF2523 domain-containing protein [Variovorax sp. EL159]SCX69075.1 Protein of unknown function [Variovorax sp. EL159]
MPAILLALGTLLLQLVGSMAGRVLVALGIGVVTYSGINTTIGWAKSQAISAILGLGPEVVGMLTMLKVGQSINIVFSAMLAKAVINGVQGDTFKRWVHK